MPNSHPSSFDSVCQQLLDSPKKWLVTGAAGFIGTNLCKKLLGLNQSVVGIDNFITGQTANIEFLNRFSAENDLAQWNFIEGDIRELNVCQRWVADADYILHQAALGSVPRSIKFPLASHEHNVNGFLNILEAARESQKNIVFASSSSVYGDAEGLPKVEDNTGNVLSPYAATKAIDELYAQVYARTYNICVTGLRYFNVFGPFQDPNGVYAAVIPRWVQRCLNQEAPEIFGDGETTRDFCYVENAVQANILAAVHAHLNEPFAVYNVAAERQTSLNQLLATIQEKIAGEVSNYKRLSANYQPFRAGDIRHSLADVSSAREQIGYNPKYDIDMGLTESIGWYVRTLKTDSR